MPKMELLAPVGSSEALRAAVQNGADAVYFGGKLFNARQYAENFSLEDIRERVRYAHLHGVRVYVTVNTLITNEELPELINYLYSLYENNVDAVIVQDLGVAYLVRTLLPNMAIHASTQMTIHNSPGIRFLEERGFARAVLAREVALRNIALIKKQTQLDLEVFVHGALCVSYSGQCLMSSMIGGRSGNRGRCAQPCRLAYTLVDEAGKEIKAVGQHLLSPRDLKMVDHLPLLAQAKVASLKVEGRMKRPEYVATVIRNYRKALDEYYKNPETFQVGEDTQKELEQIFNRDFTTGYFLEKPGVQLMSYQRPNNRGIKLGRVVNFNPKTNKVTLRLEESLAVGDGYVIWVTKGGRIAGEIKHLQRGNTVVERAEDGEVTFSIQGGTPRVGDRVFKTMDYELMEKARTTFISAQGIIKYPLDFSVKIREGHPVSLEARDGRGYKAQVEGQFIVEKAEKHALTEEDIERQLKRLGDTVFVLGKLDIQMEPGLMVPLSELNTLRRNVVAKIEEMKLAEYAKPSIQEGEYKSKVEPLFTTLLQPKVLREKIKLSVQVGDFLSLQGAVEAGAELLYFGGDNLRRKNGFAAADFPEVVKKCHAGGARAMLVVPRIFQEEELARVKEYCLKGKEAGVDGFLVGNVGALQLAEELGLTGVRGDYTLNIFNDFAVQALLLRGAEGLTLSPELTLQQLAAFSCRGNTGLECLIHGRLPLMVTEHCMIGNLLGKGHQERGCLHPCLKTAYGLRDRLNMIFPVESDENCRMHIFNPKTLNMLGHLREVGQAGVGILRIEARREEPYWVRKVVEIYRWELERLNKEGDDYKPLLENIQALKNLSPKGFTTGHYFRGVE